MIIAIPDINPIVSGVSTQCDIFAAVANLITMSNAVKASSNEHTVEIGDVDLLAPNTNLTDAILDLQSAIHVPAVDDGNGVVNVNATTQEVSFDLAGLVSWISNPLNVAQLNQLKTLIDTNIYITSIAHNAAAPGTFNITYNTGLTSTFSYGLSTNPNNALTYGTDGLPYFSTTNFVPRTNFVPQYANDGVTIAFYAPATV